MVGLCLTFGLYVATHGQLTPGGGFQGGVVIASAWVLLYLAGSAKTYQRMTPKPLVEALEAAGAAAYVLIGAGGLLFAGAFLANFVPLGPPATLWSGGTIALLSVSTGIEVAGGFVLLATTFVEEALDERAEE
jgi:multicomponent Na+:H+ antiporter subunit B